MDHRMGAFHTITFQLAEVAVNAALFNSIKQRSNGYAHRRFPNEALMMKSDQKWLDRSTRTRADQLQIPINSAF